MSKKIEFDRFHNYALKLLKNGTKVCPCCLFPRVLFTTDDEHDEFWLECASCHVGVRSHIFSDVHSAWENRPSNIPGLNKVTHDVKCSYWDDSLERVRYVTLDKQPDIKLHGT